jgi:hypothetical protein
VSRFLEPGQGTAFAEAMSVALDVLRDHGLRLDAQLTLAVKAMAQASVIVSTLRPGATINDFLALGLEHTQELIAEQATAERFAREAKRHTTTAALDFAERLPRLRQGIERWLEHLEHGEITLKLDTSDLERQVQAASDASRLVSIGLILGGILVGSAVAASVGSLGGRFLDFLPKFALVAYVVALAVATLAVLGLAWGQYRRRRSTSARERA